MPKAVTQPLYLMQNKANRLERMDQTFTVGGGYSF